MQKNQKKKERPLYKVKDLKVVLKDLEPFIRDPKYLYQGIRISNFDLLIREAWGNWLLCVVFRDVLKQDITFQEGEHGDGIIINNTT